MLSRRGIEKLAGMAVFAKVVDTGSFSAAARALGYSKSSVSKTVSRLEDQLGVRVLNRTTRHIKLTEVGAELYERVSRMLADVDEAERAAEQYRKEATGTLHVDAPTSFGRRHLAPAIPAFMEKHPQLNVELTLNDRFVDLIEEGYDAAVRVANLPNSSLIARRLSPNRRIVCGSPEYVRRTGAPRHPKDLARHNCLGYTYQVSGDLWRFSGPDGPTQVRVSGTLKSNNGDILREAAIAGTGLVFLPTFSVWEELRSGKLVPVLPDYVNVEASIYVVYPHRRHVSAKVRAFVDFLSEQFRPVPYWDIVLGDETPDEWSARG